MERLEIDCAESCTADYPAFIMSILMTFKELHEFTLASGTWMTIPQNRITTSNDQQDSWENIVWESSQRLPGAMHVLQLSSENI